MRHSSSCHSSWRSVPVHGLLVKYSGSIRPSILLHALADFIVIPVSYGLVGSFSVESVSVTGIDRQLIIWVAVMVICLAAFVPALRVLGAEAKRRTESGPTIRSNPADYDRKAENRELQITWLRVAINRSITYRLPMGRVRIRLAKSNNCRALAEMRDPFRAKTEPATEAKSRFVRRCTSWMKKAFSRRPLLLAVLGP